MVVEQDVLSMADWFSTVLPQFGALLLFFALASLALAYLFLALLNGPLVGGEKLFWSVTGAIGDAFHFSPRRIMALSWLAFQESIRRRVLAAFLVFMALLLFGSWFLDREGGAPARLFLGAIIPATYFMSLLVAIFLSVFSLPTDLAQKTIYTVVTKPVRRGEIVIGRILGFSAVGTLLLLAMALASFLFINQSLAHTHSIVAQKGENIPEGERLQVISSRGHKHTIYESKDPVTGEQIYVTDFANHWHQVPAAVAQSGKGELEPPQGLFTAKVPLYGTIRFIDRQGRETAKGISVGQEWEYRSYIEGGGDSAAVWTFVGKGDAPLTPERFPNGLPIELTLRVFRTYRSDIETPVTGGLTLRNPKTKVKTKQIPFLAREYYTDRKTIGREQQDENGGKLDLFKDLVDPELGLEISLQCLDPAQYFGAARADLYINAGESNFFLNFLKGYVYIWIQMVIVTALGVMFSTVFNSAVSLLATIFSIIMGFYSHSIALLKDKKLVGGGPVESFYRLITQDNMLTPLDQGLFRTAVERIDEVLLYVMNSVAALMPDFSQFDRNLRYLVDGFNIPAPLAAQNFIALFGYLLPIIVIGYLFMRSREVAK